MTSTIHAEVKDGLVGYINRMFDKGQIRMYVPRYLVFKLAQVRLRQLWAAVGSPLVIRDARTAEVKRFYSNFATAKDKRLVDKAPHRPGHSLLPSDADMTLLAEAARLAGSDKVALLSGDPDFTSFAADINKEFAVTILNLFQFPGDANSIRGLLTQI